MAPPGSVRRRGQPIVALVLLLLGWGGVRAAILGAEATAVDGPAVQLANTPDQQGKGSTGPATIAGSGPSKPEAQWPVGAGSTPELARPSPNTAEPPLPLPQSVPVRESAATQPDPDQTAALRVGGGHQMLWMAGLSMLPLPPEAGLIQDRAPAPLRPLGAAGIGKTSRAAPRSAPAPLRWSADGWIVWRQGGNGFNLPGAGLPGASVPSGAYGASQAGMVVRYRLAPSSPLRPSLYLRGSSALQAPRGEEVAGGFALRPLKGVPVSAMAEVRATRTVGGKVVVRPAVALVSEFPVQPLPLGLRAEAYVQAGYVGGRDATPFVDGQARIERPLVQMGPVELRAGGGLWGGAQNGAQRLDVGPTATLAVPVGPGGGRVSADWRFRVAGDAAPGSGPAITLSAGF